METSDSSVWLSEDAASCAEGVLSGFHPNERSVEDDLKRLFGVTGCKYESASRVGNREQDIVIPAARVVIEVKKPGRAVDPYAKGSGGSPDESAFEQLCDYVSKQREDDALRLDQAELEPWRGVVCDDNHFHLWEWPVSPYSFDEPSHKSSDVFAKGQGVELATWWMSVCEHGSGLAPLPPDFVESLYASHRASLRLVDNGIPISGDREAIRTRDTQFTIWLDMLEGADMKPSPTNVHRLFLSHTFLIVVARLVASALSGSTSKDGVESVISDGFVSWLSKTSDGVAWTERVAATTRRYDWRAAHGDVLREMYEIVIDKPIRKYFGEYYTPDWLAEMIVEDVCDEDWCDAAINAALSQHNNQPLEGQGVLDPTCGSGTFLYHAAKRLLSRPLLDDTVVTPTRAADVVARLVSGIDIHPIAVEIARATLLRALPATPSSGMDAIRVWQGDSLGESTSQFQYSDDNHLAIHSPQGSTFLLPLAFLRQGSVTEQLRLFVSAAQQHDGVLPEFLLAGLASDVISETREAFTALKNVIANEGNGIWAWFIAHQYGPHELSRTKINRIVANPPWVTMSEIQEPKRKTKLEELAKSEGIWPTRSVGARGAFDIAALFLRICNRRYQINSDAKSGWLTNAGAIKGRQWQRYNDTKPPTRTLDLSEVKKRPFRGAMCCVHYIGQEPKTKLQTLTMKTGSTIQREDIWDTARDKVQIADVAAIPESKSGYLKRRTPRSKHATQAIFTAGLRASPLNFVVCETTKHTGTEVEFHTRLTPRSHKKWKTYGVQQGKVPEHWIRDTILPDDLYPFVIQTSSNIVIPFDRDDSLLTEHEAAQSEYWRRVDRFYRNSRSRGKRIPETLLEYVKIQGNLQSLLNAHATAQHDTMIVFYNASGKHLRAARHTHRSTTGQTLLCNDKLYWYMCNRHEAGYLVSLLNTPSLANRYRASRHSDRDFHTHLWKEVPIPKYDPNNKQHRVLSQLCDSAEHHINQLLATHTSPDQTKRLIRHAITTTHIGAQLNQAARTVLPDEHFI